MINSFTTAQSGLNASQLALENSMNNIANENSVGYKKKVSYQSEVSYGNNSYGNGVEISSIQRQTNPYLYSKIVSETSTKSYYNEASNIYGSAELIFMETDEAGLSKDLNNYFSSLENLRSNPNDNIYQADFESSSNALISSMQSSYSQINDLQDSLTKQTYDEVDSVNSILNEISHINDQILKNGENTQLLDQRDLLEKELSTYVDIEVSDDNFYELKIAGERAVFNNTTVHEMQVIESKTNQIDVYDVNSLNDNMITNGDEISITLNNGETITVIADTTGASNYDVKQQIADAINANASMADDLNASVDSNGNLVVEGKKQGEDEFFDLDISINNSNISKNEKLSTQATNKVHLELLGEELSLSSGSLKATTENLTTTNPNNVLYSYKQDLNKLSNALVESYSTYEGEDLNLFSGNKVMNMTFNSNEVSNLSQQELDHLASLQFSDDINIDPSNPNSTSSFSEALQELKVQVSSNKESMDFKLETKESIIISLESSYDQLTKVDNDEEMIKIMEFQAAYEANAKVITALDEMLQTILNM